MKKHSSLKRILAVCLSLVMVLSLLPGTARAAGSGKGSVSFEKIDPSEVNADLRGSGFKAEKLEMDSDNTFKSEDRVRVMIVLPGEAAMSLMSEGTSASDPDVSAYREELRQIQEYAAQVISEEALDGEELDVVWNLTLAVNAISANVEYGQIKDIAKVNGVKAVYLERRYDPMTTGTAELNNIPAQGTTGAAAMKDAGYTGAGMRIAVIDTGTAQYHQSFDAGAFEYSLRKQAGEDVTDEQFEEYKESLNLLTAEDVEAVVDKLHAYESWSSLYDEGDFYISSKLPFGFNYIDGNVNITHFTGLEYDKDEDDYVATYSEHGSHVAGIAAANSYIPNPDGDGYVDAAETVGVTGVAPDAQIITMKVFGAHGGAYTSDNFAAIEDAMVLDCDVVNLSLGSSSGFVTARGEYRVIQGNTDDIDEEADRIDEWVDEVMDKITEKGIIMSVSAGNSGNWAEGDNYEGLVEYPESTSGFGMMYTDEGGTYNVGSPSTFHNTMSVASADNVGGVSQSKTTFTSDNGSVNLRIYSTTSMNNPDWSTMDENDGAGTEYDVVFLGDPTSGFAAGSLKVNTDPTVFGGYDRNDEPIGSADLEGKIVMIARGTSSFFEKRDAAAEWGAAAVICYNHTPGDGVVSADLTGTTSTIPFGGLSYEDGKAVFDICEEKDGLYVCKATVIGSLYVDMGEPGAMPTMSSYSSWGTTGALTIKPEITAPGGSIYSVNGGEGGEDDKDEYENMSGTSMAAPHFSGLVALTQQYIRDHDNALLKKAQAVAGSSLTERQLAQSLLMSTADPLVDYEIVYEDTGDIDTADIGTDDGGTDDGGTGDDGTGDTGSVVTVPVPYSIRNQGAGLANVQKATSAESFILVGGQPDGKVKAELGDGKTPWTFDFTIYNLTDHELTYDLSAQLMTTGTDDEYADYGLLFSTNRMVPLDADKADVTFTVDDADVSTVTVSDGESVTVTAKVTVKQAAVTAMRNLRYTNGFYVEGYVYAEPEDTTGEGVLGVTHSIPMLGWYGNWTDISMFDGDSFLAGYYGETTRLPHVYNFYGPYYFVRNILMISANGADPEDPEAADWYSGNLYEDRYWGDERYIPERNALNNTGDAWWQPTWFSPMLMRNAAAARVQVVDSETDEVYYEQVYDEPFEGAYAHGQLGVLIETTDYTLTPIGERNDGSSPFAGIPEGTDIELTFSYAPEYYEYWDTEVDENGDEYQARKIRWDDLGHGATMSFPFRIDNTAPELLAASSDGSELTVVAKDNNYIAYIAVLDGTGGFTDYPVCPDMDRNQRGKVVLEDFGIYGNKAIVALCDYAGNESFYRLNLSEVDYAGGGYGDLVAFQSGRNYLTGATYYKWVSFDATVEMDETDLFDSGITEFYAADYANGVVYAQDARGWLYGIWYDDMVNGLTDFESARIKRLDNAYQDMAYSYKDGMLYGVRVDNSDEDVVISYLDQIDLGNDCAVTQKLIMDDVYVLGLACDDDGSVYLMGLENGEGTAKLYKATKACVDGQIGYDLNGDGDVTLDDAQALMDHVVKGADLAHPELADFDGDGERTTKDVNLLLDLLGEYSQIEQLLDTEQEMDYLQSMTWDHNNETLYWARCADAGYYAEADLWEIDVEAKTCTQTGFLYDETCAMFAPLTAASAAREAHSNVPDTPDNANGAPVLVDTVLNLATGGSCQLAYDVSPWYAENKTMTWSSSDESVATVADGLVTAVGAGACTITVANAEDPELKSTCTVNVMSPELTINGTYSEMGSFIGSVSDSYLYTFTMEDGQSEMAQGPQITDPYAEPDDDFGQKIGAAVMAEPDSGLIWTCEWDNQGLLRQVMDLSEYGGDAMIIDTIQPVAGDVMMGLAYSPATRKFAGISNNCLYIDLPDFGDLPSAYLEYVPDNYDDVLDNEGTTLADLGVTEAQFALWHEIMYDYFDGDYYWHELDLTADLNASDEDFNTGEYGNGATTDVVLCGITDIGSAGAVELNNDFLGGSGASGEYTPATTLVLLDNVGRLWYVDELTGMTKDGDDAYTGDCGTVSGDTGIHTWDYKDGTCSVFVIREIVETPLTGMYWQGTMPRYTYQFSDLYYAGKDNDDNEVYLLSLYDYHNNGTTNQLYLLIMDENGGTLITLGDTGDGNVIATIYYAEVEMDSLPSAAGADAGNQGGGNQGVGGGDEVLHLAAGRYTR